MENSKNYPNLPPVKSEMHLAFPHFPTRLHAAVFRLWETVSAKQIALGLDIPEQRIRQIADDMGLPAQKYTEIWAKQGYLTTIRNAWHILPYEQLLGVLGWDADRLALCLKEDDFLIVKVGYFKPYCEPVHDTELTDDQKMQCLTIKETMQTVFSGIFDGAVPFSYFDKPTEESLVLRQSDDLRMVYSFCGLYAGVLDEDIERSYPEELLRRYRKAGINAIWLQGILYQLTPFPFDESYSAGWEKRQKNLQKLVELAGRYGIKVFLYLNEPRCMPNGFFEKHPELQGAAQESYSSLCMSVPAVTEYLRLSVQNLCRNVKGLGGFFLINMSENLTHCKSLPNTTPCKRCLDIPKPTLISNVINTITQAAKEEQPDIRIVVWTWAWDKMLTENELAETLSLLPKDVIVQSNSEASKPYTIGGISGTVADYSMSVIGPGETAKNIWSLATKNGNETCAKIQVNNTWECSTMPYLPVFDLVREHVVNLKKENVKNVMLSWTLGGYPSFNLKLVNKCFEDDSERAYDELLHEEFGEYAPLVKKASAIFSEAFREFPFHLRVAYNGPQNGGPSNPLYLEPTGFRSTMTGYTYDDLDGWRSIYPREVFREQFQKLSEKWEKGLALLDDMPNCEFKQMACGGYLLFSSSYLQTDFVMQRDAGNTASLRTIAEKEQRNAHTMYTLMLENPAIGYEAANHYYFNKMMLAEKYISCEHIKKKLDD